MIRPASRLYLVWAALYFVLTLISLLISHILVESNSSMSPFRELESFVFSSAASKKSALSIELKEANARRDVQELKEPRAVLDQKVQVIRSRNAVSAAAEYTDREEYSRKDNEPQNQLAVADATVAGAAVAKAKYAYAVVIGGCRPERPEHRGYIYNILVARRVLREFGSKADVVALIQMSSASNATELDDVDAKPLKAMDIQIKYISKDTADSFYGTVMRKFDILDLSQYRRVILLDGDVLPMGNLDYLFELSDGTNPLLKPNFVLNGFLEPSNAGFFMLEPGEGYLDEVKEIIKRTEESSREHGFNRYIGWGHPIQPPDEWVARKERGTNWTFLFAESDQGLLYYYAKYHRKSVSLIQYGAFVENWGTDANGNLVKEGDTLLSIKNYSRPYVSDFRACIKFLCDFKHFTGHPKPWQIKPAPTSESTKYKDPLTLWWYTLKHLDKQLAMGLDFENWTIIKGQPLGYYAFKEYTISNFKGKPKK